MSTKLLYLVFLLVGLSPLQASAHAQFPNSRYAELLALHIEGNLDIGNLALKTNVEKELEFVCYWKGEPNKPISLKLDYQSNHNQKFPAAVAYAFESDSPTLMKIVRANNFVLEPSHLADFSGLLLVGGAAEAGSVDFRLHSNFSGAPQWHLALSQHAQSKTFVLSIFNDTSDNHENDDQKSCEQKNQFEYLCSQAAFL
jgi:hypothetical protein